MICHPVSNRYIFWNGRWRGEYPQIQSGIAHLSHQSSIIQLRNDNPHIRLKPPLGMKNPDDVRERQFIGNADSDLAPCAEVIFAYAPHCRVENAGYRLGFTEKNGTGLCDCHGSGGAVEHLDSESGFNRLHLSR